MSYRNSKAFYERHKQELLLQNATAAPPKSNIFCRNVTITVTIFPLKWPRMLNNGHLAPKGNII